MPHPKPRTISLMAAVVCVWVVTYWLYDPSGSPPPVTFDDRAAASDPQPVQPVRPESDLPPPTSTPPPAPVAARPPSQPGERVIPPEFREVVVQAGDTGFESIAARIYGDRRKWQAIARANPYVTPDRLIPGRTVLRVPVDPDNIQGRVVPAQPTREPQPSTQPTRQPDPPARTYTVQRGDTLSEIARAMYGKSSEWQRIYNANRDTLETPERLAPGMVLRIPDMPGSRN